MDRRALLSVMIAIVVLVIVVVTAGWWLFVDTPAITPSELSATTSDPAVADAPAALSITIEARSRGLEDGTVEANWSAAVRFDASDGERIGRLSSSDDRGEVEITHYQRLDGDQTHNVIEYHSTDAEQFARRVQSIREDLEPRTETLEVDEEAQTYRYYREGERSEFEVVPDLLPPLGFIQVLPFERAGSTTYDGESVARYVPVDGWRELPGSVADDGPDVYLSRTSGVLYVEEEAGDIVYANVSFTSKRTDRRAGRWLGDAGSRGQFRLVVRKELDHRGLEPAWTDEPPFDGG